MKKTISTLLALILFLTAFCAIGSAEGKIMYVKTSNGGKLNMRSEPKSGNNIIAQIPYAAAVIVLAEYDKTWSDIEYAGISNPGYVQTQFLSDKMPAAYTGETLPNRAVYQSFTNMKMDRWYSATVQTLKGGNDVSLRWSPTSNGTVMRKIAVGEIVTVIAEGKNWNQVLDESTGMVGFMPSKYLVKVPNLTPVSAVEAGTESEG